MGSPGAIKRYICRRERLTAFAFLSSDDGDPNNDLGSNGGHNDDGDDDSNNNNSSSNSNNDNTNNNDNVKSSNDNEDDVDEQSYSLDDDFEDLGRSQDAPGDTPPPAWKPGSPYVANDCGDSGGDKVRLGQDANSFGTVPTFLGTSNL